MSLHGYLVLNADNKDKHGDTHSSLKDSVVYLQLELHSKVLFQNKNVLRGAKHSTLLPPNHTLPLRGLWLPPSLHTVKQPVVCTPSHPASLPPHGLLDPKCLGRMKDHLFQVSSSGHSSKNRPHGPAPCAKKSAAPSV